MNDYENLAEMPIEARLKAIAYQFVALYERWAEDRQVAAKQGADTAELVQLFTEQVEEFKKLQPKIQGQLKVQIQQAFDESMRTVNQKIDQAASQQLDRATTRLNQSVSEVTQHLHRAENESLKMVVIFAVLFLASCLFMGFMVGKWAIPQPISPLSSQDLQTYQNGQVFDTFWNKLSKKEQNRLLKIGTEAQTDNSDNASDDDG